MNVEDLILVSVDDHIVEPPTMFDNHLAPEWKARAPRVVRKKDGSDGIVPYWSSHLDGAASERIVPSGHSTHQHPEGIEELERILYLHLDSVDSSE